MLSIETLTKTAVKNIFTTVKEWDAAETWSPNAEASEVLDERLYGLMQQAFANGMSVPETLKDIESIAIKVPEGQGDRLKHLITKQIQATSRKGDLESPSKNGKALANYLEILQNRYPSADPAHLYSVQAINTSEDSQYDHVYIFMSSIMRSLIAADLLQQEPRPRTM